MRRTTIACALLVMLLPALDARAEESTAGDEVTAEDLAEMVRAKDAFERTLAAQYLQHAPRQRLLDVLGLLARQGGAVEAVERKRPRTWKQVYEEIQRRKKEGDKPPVPLLNSEVRVLSIADGSIDAVLGALRPDGGKVTFPTDGQVRALLGQVADGGIVQQVTAPRLSMFDGQSGSISIANQISYVPSVDTRKVGESGIAEPQIDTLHDGMWLQVRPVLSKDKKYVTVSFTGIWTAVERPLREYTSPLGQGDSRVRVHVPRIRMGRKRLDVTLPSGGYALLAAPRLELDSGRTQYVLLNVRALELDPAFVEDVSKPRRDK